MATKSVQHATFFIFQNTDLFPKYLNKPLEIKSFYIFPIYLHNACICLQGVCGKSKSPNVHTSVDMVK